MREEVKRLQVLNIDLERSLGVMRVKLRDLLVMKAGNTAAVEQVAKDLNALFTSPTKREQPKKWVDDSEELKELIADLKRVK